MTADHRHPNALALAVEELLAEFRIESATLRKWAIQMRVRGEVGYYQAMRDRANSLDALIDRCTAKL